jgi:hypothetical protein
VPRTIVLEDFKRFGEDSMPEPGPGMYQEERRGAKRSGEERSVEKELSRLVLSFGRDF